MTDRETNEVTLDELRSQALAHYIEASNAIHHWSSFVEDAIKNYTPQRFIMTDRERAKEILEKNANLFQEHPFTEMYKGDKEAILKCMIEFRNEGLREDNTKELLQDIISWEKNLSEYKSLEAILRERYYIHKKSN